MTTVTPRGKTYVTNERGEPLEVVSVMGHLMTPTGGRLQVKRAFVNAPANTADTELVPAVADAVIRIVALLMVAGDTETEVTLKSKESGEASVAISPVLANAANGGAVLPFNEHGWFQALDVARAVTVTTSAGSDVGILVQFVEIPTDAFDLL